MIGPAAISIAQVDGSGTGAIGGATVAHVKTLLAALGPLLEGVTLSLSTGACVTDPTLLLCDEPTGDLDRKSGDEILDLLQGLNREHGKTIVMVTHDPRAADRATRTLHLEKGSLVGAGA